MFNVFKQISDFSNYDLDVFIIAVTNNLKYKIHLFYH